MTESTLPSEILEYYRRGGEATRLTEQAEGRLEFLRTQDILRRLLPGDALSIVDVGGGHGVHADWLTADGHRVELVDPVPEHVAAAGRLPGVIATLGDARDLPRADDSADAVLLLGPMYHLQEPADRLRALREARRVCRPGGLVAAATINRFAGWHDVVNAHAWDRSERMTELLDQDLSTGRHESMGSGLFTTAYFHRPEEIAAEFTTVGLTDSRQYAIEGAVWLMRGLEAAFADETALPRVLAGLRRLENEPSLLGVSSHLLTAAIVAGS